MDNGRADKEFDDLLRKHYAGHSVEPGEELWEAIESKLYQKKTDAAIHKARQLKFAISSVAAMLAGVIVYSIVTTRENKADLSARSKVAGEQPCFEIAEGIPIKMSPGTKVIDFNPATPINILNESLTRVPDSGKTGLSHKTDELPASGISPVTAIIIKDDVGFTSIKLTENTIALSPVLAGPATGKSAGSEMTDDNALKRLPETPDQAELLIQAAAGSAVKQAEAARSGHGIRRSSFFVEGTASPEISYRALTVNSKYSMPDYGKQYFNKAERPDLTFSAGISGGLVISDRFILKSGISWSQYSFKFKTAAFNIIDTGPDGSLVYTSSGPVNIKLFSSDSLSEESLIRSSVSFSFVNIPFEAEFHFGNNYFVNLGLILNILAGQNMNWQAENYDGNFYEMAVDPIDGLEFTGLSMTVGACKEEYITRQLSVLINPSVRINLTSLNTTAPVRSYPYSLSFNAGLRYYFD
jgi:hypothetical protein